MEDAAAKLSDADAESLAGNLQADPSTLAPSLQAFLDGLSDCLQGG